MTGQTSSKILPSICLLVFTAFLKAETAPRVDEDKQIGDISSCLQKEAEYCAKASCAKDAKIQSTYEAIAREFAYRAKLLKEIKRP